MNKGEGMEKMLEAYLAAVAAQLPQERREDITAELKDEILTRVEVREEGLGRPLSEDEFEQMLREVGHPLVVAARYADGPQGIVGPELYPWWEFSMRVALLAVAGVTVLGVLLQVLGGRGDVVDLIGHGIRQALTGAVSAVGLVTAAGWIIERLERKPAFLTQWKVKDLGLYQWPASFMTSDMKAFGEALQNGSVGAGPKGKAAGRGSHDGFSPVAGAAASAVFTTIILAWWLGGLDGLHFNNLLGDAPLKYEGVLGQIHQVLYWPLAALLAARIVFDVVRVATGSPVRLTAVGDVVLTIATLGLLVWFWFVSPMGEVFGVSYVQDLLNIPHRTELRADPVASAVRVIAVLGFATELMRLYGAVLRMVTGKDRRQPE